MGVQPHAMAMNQRRSASRAAMRSRFLKGTQANHGIVAVDLGKVEVGEVRHQPRNVSARRVHLDGHADRVAVVLNAEDHRQLSIRGGVDRLPELALRSRAFAHASQSHFVAVEVHVAKGAIVALHLRCGLGVPAESPPSLGAAHGMKQLRRRSRTRCSQYAADGCSSGWAFAARRLPDRWPHLRPAASSRKA